MDEACVYALVITTRTWGGGFSSSSSCIGLLLLLHCRDALVGRDRNLMSHHFHVGASAAALTAFLSSLRLAISFSLSSLLSPARLTAGEALGSSAVELLSVTEDDPLLSHPSETGAGVGRDNGGVFD